MVTQKAVGLFIPVAQHPSRARPSSSLATWWRSHVWILPRVQGNAIHGAVICLHRIPATAIVDEMGGKEVELGKLTESTRAHKRYGQGSVGEKDAMTLKETLKEMDRLKSNCSANSYIYALLIVRCLSLLFRYSHACAPNPCL